MLGIANINSCYYHINVNAMLTHCCGFGTKAVLTRTAIPANFGVCPVLI